MMGWNDGMMGGWSIGLGVAGWLIQLLFFIAIIYLAFVLIRRLHHAPGSGRENHSEEILRERFAQGEITAEEYKKMKEILKK
ncbi:MULTISPECIES: SHOCT domain-containing protein [unclassified Sporolactobacillus]|uniref:SHOCT domain-containing protein n=1 Tax=unclassified Sporolactobacillus TaxID=2628533 RepID=UPI002367428D|nr:SHOCT domain-containing protein [Sporolactobacillus sp. CQH2019]MDD9148560.1 SHOCT domain-containing protein [Sporolactobacillus sp. CQH2019]